MELKRPEGLQVAKRLVVGADVLVQNFRPGVMARLGLGYDAVAPLNPRLIYVSGSGYREASPYRDRPGQDLLIQAMSGLAALSGRAGQPPTAVGGPVVEQHGAALLAMGVLAALFDRSRTGRGQKVEVTMVRAALVLQMEVVTYHLNGARMEKSPTSLASMFHPGPYGIYGTKDGYLALSMSPFPVLQAALQQPELAPLATERFNPSARERIASILEPVMRTRATAEWVEFLVPRGVWAAPVLEYDGVFADPAVQEANVMRRWITPPPDGCDCSVSPSRFRADGVRPGFLDICDYHFNDSTSLFTADPGGKPEARAGRQRAEEIHGGDRVFLEIYTGLSGQPLCLLRQRECP